MLTIVLIIVLAECWYLHSLGIGSSGEDWMLFLAISEDI